MSYNGPGVYRHYKGGLFDAVGVAEHESTGQRFIIYKSRSIEYNAERLARGADLIARPADIEDCLPQSAHDPFNAPLAIGGVPVERFEKIDET